MDLSPELKDLAVALAKSQAIIKDPIKEKNADLGKYKYKYADLPSTLKEIRAAFAPHGLSLIQTVSGAFPDIKLTTMILHESGQYIKDSIVFSCQDQRLQGLGSLITYLRRYHAGPMAGIAAEEDVDGVAQEIGAKKEVTPDTLFDPADEDHLSALSNILIKNNVNKEFWDDIAFNLKGRAIKEAGVIYRQIKETTKVVVENANG